MRSMATTKLADEEGAWMVRRRGARLAIILLALALAGCGGPKVVPNAPVTIEDVPPAALAAAKKKFPDVKFTDAWQTPAGDFELMGQTKQGKRHEMVVSAAGQVLEAE
jgi:hypothetical protein